MAAESLTGQIVEIWFLYVIGAVMIGARIFCRTKLIGWRNYEWDDYLIVAIGCMWTAAPVIGQVFVQVADGKHTSDLSYEDRKNMPVDERQDWAYGSQIFLLGLTGYFVIIWMLKFNMLCFYSRVVRALWTEKFIKPLMIFVVVSGVAILLTLALTCRPFENLWQVWPDPGPHCVPQNLVFFVVILVFNLFTDLCIMLVPIPVLQGIQVNRLQKLGLWLLFTLGFFCMFAAILRFVLIFQLKQKGVSALWSLREDCVGIFVGQAPLVTPMLRRRFWVNAGYATPKTGSTPLSRSRGDAYHRTVGESHELRSGTGVHISKGKPNDPYSMTTLGIGSDSQEEIMSKANLPGRSRGIVVQHSIDIENSAASHHGDAKDPRW